jgi:cytochrome P450
LRFEAPVQFTSRVALEPTEIEGVQVEPEILVNLALGMANHDPRRFERPDQLDVRRADVKPLSFGGGPHFCIGAALARMEARIAFAKLLERTRTIELAIDQPVWRPQLTLRGLTALPVNLTAS